MASFMLLWMRRFEGSSNRQLQRLRAAEIQPTYILKLPPTKNLRAIVMVFAVVMWFEGNRMLERMEPGVGVLY